MGKAIHLYLPLTWGKSPARDAETGIPLKDWIRGIARSHSNGWKAMKAELARQGLENEPRIIAAWAARERLGKGPAPS